jgi:hypothetical protein
VLLIVLVVFYCRATSFGRAFEVSPSGSSGGPICSLLINMMFRRVASLLTRRASSSIGSRRHSVATTHFADDTDWFRDDPSNPSHSWSTHFLN